MATNRQQFDDLMVVLGGFAVDEYVDLLTAGGNETEAAARLNESFRARGWFEAQYQITVGSELVLRKDGTPVKTESGESATASYFVDNVKGRVAIDVEWHAKDGNLDRDIAAYRAFYDAGIIDCGVMVTTARDSLREWVVRLDPTSTKFKTTTVTSIEKVTPRLARGDGGGCPILVAGICNRTI
jgi:hypothetical protein